MCQVSWGRCGISSLCINPPCVYSLDKWGDWNNQSFLGIGKGSSSRVHTRGVPPCHQANWGGDAPPHLLFLGSAWSSPDKLLPL